MTDELIQRSVQFSRPLFDELSKIAKNKDISFAAIVREACIEYLDKSTPGLCPSCHTQNQPDSQYCQKCGEPITGDESLREYVKRLEMRIEQLERMVQVGKIAYENKEMILNYKEEMN